MSKDMSRGRKAVASRMVHAEEAFLGTLMTLGDIDRPAAERALSCFRKVKAVKMDAVNGVMSVAHGALLDRDVIRRAAS